MRCLTLALIAIAAPARADLILAPEDGNSNFASVYRIEVQGSVAGTGDQVHLMADIHGSGVLHQNSEIGLFDLSFTRPAHYTSLQFNFTTVEIWHDPQTWTLPLASMNIPQNSNQLLAFIPDHLWARDNLHQGHYRITGFRGEVVEGTFSLARTNSGPHTAVWEVTSRFGDPVTGQITGLEGTLNPSYQPFDISQRFFDGDVDGIRVRLTFLRQENP